MDLPGISVRQKKPRFIGCTTHDFVYEYLIFTGKARGACRRWKPPRDSAGVFHSVAGETRIATFLRSATRHTHKGRNKT